MKNKLYGAILGDLAGQKYEYHSYGISMEDFNLHDEQAHITDDTIMTLASADMIMNNLDPEQTYKKWGQKYDNPNLGYGSNFLFWLADDPTAYTCSYGNGCLMRFSPFIWAPKKFKLGMYATACSHNHADSFDACAQLQGLYQFPEMVLSDFDPAYVYPEHFAINARETIHIVTKIFKENFTTTQEAIKFTVSLGGDTDTNASIVGELYNYHRNDLTKQDIEYVESKLDSYQLEILHKFNSYEK